MDRAEAIELLKACWNMGDCGAYLNGGKSACSKCSYRKALDLAIEALQGDLHCPKCGTIVRDGRQYHDLVYRGEAEKHQLSEETSTTSEKESVEGDAESATTTDCISRQQAIDGLCQNCEAFDCIVNGSYCGHDCTEVEILRSLPPVTPTERTGGWEYEPLGTTTRCSVCGKGFKDGFGIRTVCQFNYCPNCGAKMGGDTE